MPILAWLGSAWNWIANSKPAQYALIIIGIILAFKTVQLKARMDGEKAERDRQAKRNAKEQARVSETQRTIERNMDEASTRADAARDALPRFESAEQLRDQRPDIAADILPNGH